MKKIFAVIFVVMLVLIVSAVVYGTMLRTNLIISKSEVKSKLSQPESHFLHWRGAEIHYTDEGKGIPVLMIHGFGGSFLNWNKLRDRMNRDYRVIRIDLPGFGMSDLPLSTDYVREYRDFMTFFLDTMYLDSVYVVGNSMGGMMSWGAAADHPDRVKKLVLISSAGYDMEKISNDVARFMKIPLLQSFFERGMPLSSSEGAARKVYCDHSKINPVSVRNNNIMWNRDGNIRAACAIVSNGTYPDTSMIASVKCPTLILWGKQDKVIPVEHAYRFMRDIRGAKLIVFDTCGHCAMMEKPDETAAVIRKFFSE